jgi:excinuclease ABC subunit A
MESMSPYARQFVEQLPRPDIDLLTGIPPAVAIEQRVTRGTRKSTVATITEVAQYLRLLYARLGVQHHPDTGHPITPLTPAQLRAHLAKILATDPRVRKAKKLYLCAPLIRSRKGHHQPIATWIEKQGFTHMRADGRLFPVTAFQKLDRYKEHDIEVIIADLKTPEFQRTEKQRTEDQRTEGQKTEGKKVKRPPATTPSSAPRPPSSDLCPPSSVTQTLDEALRLGHGSCFLLTGDNKILTWLSTTRTDAATGETFPELDPKNFSINSPRGWCPACRGHGRIHPWMLALDEHQNDTTENRDIALQLKAYGIDSAEDISDRGEPCPQCHGDRLNRIARSVRLHFTTQPASPPAPPPRAAPSALRRQPAARQPSALQPFSPSALSLPSLLRLTPAALLAQLRHLDQTDPRTRAITQDILPQIEERLRFLDHVGLGYLTLDRPTETLSGGESQRIRLAAQLGSNLSGVLYVLDEPSIGLHARDNARLIETLETLRAKGNTLLVVEHDDELMRHADRIIDLGPAAGIHGGELLAEGTPSEIRKTPSSLTGIFLKKGIKHPLRGAYRALPPTPGSPTARETRVYVAQAAKPATAPPPPDLNRLKSI